MTANQEIHIVQQTQDLLVVEQSSGSPASGVSGLLVCLLIGGLGFFLWKRRWAGAVLMVAFVAAFSFNQSRASEAMTRLSLQPASVEITWQTLRNGKVVDTTSANAGEFRTADLDSTGAGSRLTLTRWSGGQEFPLGEGYQAESTLQQTVLADLRTMLLAGRSSTSNRKDLR